MAGATAGANGFAAAAAAAACGAGAKGLAVAAVAEPAPAIDPEQFEGTHTRGQHTSAKAESKCSQQMLRSIYTHGEQGRETER